MLRLFQMTLMAMAVVSIQAAEFNVDNNTVALWHFNEAGGTATADAGSNKCNGTVSSGVTFVDGIFGKAVLLGGYNSESFIKIDNSNALNLTGDFSVEFWCKPVALGFGGQNTSGGMIMSKHQAGAKTDGGWWLRINYMGSTGLVFAGCCDYESAASSRDILPEWMYIAFSYRASDGEVAFYINGEKSATQIMKNYIWSPGSVLKRAIANNDKPVIIGAEGLRTDANVGNGESMFEGILDEMRVSRALRTEQEILAHWNANKDRIPEPVHIQTGFLKVTRTADAMAGAHYYSPMGRRLSGIEGTVQGYQSPGIRILSTGAGKSHVVFCR
jgi:hypothetical protein